MTLRSATAGMLREKTRARAPRSNRSERYSEEAGHTLPPGMELAGASVLVCVDGSEGPLQALRQLLQWPRERVTLLYVSPSAADGYVECGWLILEAALHRCHHYASHPPLRCRLEVGDASERIVAVCREEQPDVVALPARQNQTPSVPGAHEVARTVASVSAGHVILTSPRGIEIVEGAERLGRVRAGGERGTTRSAAQERARAIFASSR